MEFVLSFGNRFAFNYCEQLFKDISVKDGYLYCGKRGSGHYVTRILNGIEHSNTQSVDEAFETMQKAACTQLQGVHLVPGAGHWVQQEQPQRVNELLLAFLRRNP